MHLCAGQRVYREYGLKSCNDFRPIQPKIRDKGWSFMKKIITILMALCMLISYIPSVSYADNRAENSDITIEFGESVDMSKISARVGDSVTEPKIIEQEGKSVWHIGSTVWNDENLYLNVNDSITQTFEEYEDIYLDIEYYDETSQALDAAFFEIRYIDAGGAEARSETVWGKGSKKFIKSTVKLTAPQMTNSFDGSDFVLTTRSLTQEYSAKGIKISKITIRPSNTKSSIIARITTDKTGNIMYDSDSAKAFKCSIINRSDIEAEILCTLNVLDDNGNLVETHDKTVIADIGETAFYMNYNTCRYGTFTAEFIVKSSSNTFTTECPFSYNRYSEEKNDRLCTCVHLDDIDRNPIKTLELISNIGIGWIRNEMKWSLFETEKGIYKLSDAQKKYLDYAKKNNLKVLIILGFGNTLYMKNEQTLPKSTEQKNAFYNYVYNLVLEIEKDYGDVIGAYELWNEPTIEQFNYNMEASGADYTEMARITKNAMEAAKSNRKLLGLAMTGIHDDVCYQWCEDAYAAGLGNYVDAVSLHPYYISASPTAFRLARKIEKIRQLPKLYGGNTEVWITEHGWPTTPDIQETTQAMYLIRGYLIAMSDNDFGNYSIYQFQDGGNDPYEAEHQYGVIRKWADTEVPYAAKKAYPAIANMNYQLKNMECINRTQGSSYDIFRFESNNNDSYTDVVYNRYDTIATYIPEKPRHGYSLTIYDMYGNEIKDTSHVKVNGEPIYATYKRQLSDETSVPIPSIVRAEQKEKYGNVQLSGQRDGETGVDFVVLKNGKTYSDFLDNPIGCVAYFNTVIPQNGNFSDEFYITNAIGKMNIIIHYQSDNTYKKISFDLTNQLTIEESVNSINCMVDYTDDAYDAYVAQYKQGILKKVTRFNSPKENIPKESGTDKVKAFLWKKGTMEPLCPYAELTLVRENFINAGISDNYTVNFDGIADDNSVGVIIYRENMDWNNLQTNNAAGEEIVYFNEIPTLKNRYNGQYVIDGKSGLYRVRVSDFTGAELNNILVLYSNQDENATAMAKLLQASKQSEEEMLKTANEYRYELSLYHPNTSDDIDTSALKEVYNYIKSNEITAQDGKVVSEIYNKYISDNK